MAPVRFLPGTKSPASPSDYTDAQYRALEAVKQTTPPLKFGAARPEFVNHAMLADGSIVSDLTPIAAAAATQRANEPGNLDELNAHIAEGRFLFIVDCDLIPRIYFQCHTGNNPDVELA